MITWIRRRDRWEMATLVLLGIFAVLIVATFRDYGITVDEQHSSLNGTHFLNWYASGFRDRAVINDNNQRLYGSFFNGISAFAAEHSSFDRYETGHLVIAVAALVGILFAYRLGRLLGGSMAGFFSALILTITPTYYGHAFMNPKDIPFAVLFLVSLYYLLRIYDRLPRPGASAIAGLGLALGLTLGIRIGALMLFGYFVVLVGLWVTARFRKEPSYQAALMWTDLRAATATFVKAGVVAWIVMLAWWPYAQLNPILNPLRAFRHNARFADFTATDLYRGQFISSSSLPWHYLPTWFLITLPEFYVIILCIGLAALIIRVLIRRETRRVSDADFQSRLLFLVFAIVFPVMTAIALRPILYDGNRHFLFVIPPLAVLSGVTLSWLLTRGLPRPLAYVLALVVLLAGGATVLDMIRLHPYEYVFFNRSNGGLRAALGRFETDYWGESHKEGVDWLVAHYRQDAPPASIRVATTGSSFQTAHYLQGTGPSRRFIPVMQNDDPDVVLSVTRWNAHLKHPGKVLHIVERMGTPLLYVVEIAGRH